MHMCYACVLCVAQLYSSWPLKHWNETTQIYNPSLLSCSLMSLMVMSHCDFIQVSLDLRYFWSLRVILVAIAHWRSHLFASHHSSRDVIIQGSPPTLSTFHRGSVAYLSIYLSISLETVICVVKCNIIRKCRLFTSSWVARHHYPDAILYSVLLDQGCLV